MITRFPDLFAFIVIASTPLFAAVEAAADERRPLAIGAPLPEFALPGIDDKVHRSADYDKDVLAVIFTCNHCPTAQAYEERLKALVKEYGPKGVDWVAISPNADKAVRLDEQGYSIVGDSLEDMKIHAETYGFNFPYLYDGETQTVSEAFGVVATPHLYLFDRDRKLRYQGRIDDSEDGENVQSQDARKALEALLAGREVPVAQTRVFGCSTKWLEKSEGADQSEATWEKREVTLERIDAEGVKRLAGNETDKLRLINVWATWCGPCVAEMPELVKLNRIYERRGLELVTLSADDPDHEENVLKFLKSEHVAVSRSIEGTLAEEERRTNNYLFSGEDKDALAEALDPEWRGGYPHTVLIAPGGEVIHRQTGEVDIRELRKAIVGFVGRTYSGRQWAP